MIKNLYGLSGYARSGKDEVAKILVRDHGFVRVAFADALKEEVADVLKITVPAMEREKARFRPILQWWGTEWRRTQEDGYWLERWRERALGHESVVVTDVRFPNEAAEIKRLGGKMVRVNRPGTNPANSHSSETALDNYPFDLIVPNTGTLDDLALFAEMLTWPEIETANFFQSEVASRG